MKPTWKPYLERSIEDLSHIQPLWAYGRNYRKARYTQDFLKDGCIIYHAKTIDIIKHLEFGEVQLDKLFTGENKNDTRVARLLHHWDNHEFVDPPNIYVPERSSIINFGDGRHRTKTAYLLGQLQMPIIIPKGDIPFIKERIAISRKPF